MNIQDLSASYKGFLSQSQTERLCVRTIIAALEKNGFSLMNRSSSLSDGDKVYEVIKGKTVFAAIVGKEPDKIRLVGSHIDSPKLDLKANPLYGKGNLLMLSLHDYGWIKPYQWVNTPLGLYGLVILKDGTELPVDLKDTAFSIADIPPHISRDQLKQPMSEGFAVSQLNAIGGCLDGSDSQSSVEEKVYGLLKEAYGIEKEDFAVADLCLLPKNEPMDVGFDHALIGAYGQDDRICAFTSLSALLATSEPRHTALSWFVDKEEVASTGDTSAQSLRSATSSGATARCSPSRNSRRTTYWRTPRRSPQTSPPPLIPTSRRSLTRPTTLTLAKASWWKRTERRDQENSGPTRPERNTPM